MFCGERFGVRTGHAATVAAVQFLRLTNRRAQDMLTAKWLPYKIGRQTKMQVKLVEDMTDEECRKYCEEFAQEGAWQAHFMRSALANGDTYRQIAFVLQNF